LDASSISIAKPLGLFFEESVAELKVGFRALAECGEHERRSTSAANTATRTEDREGAIFMVSFFCFPQWESGGGAVVCDAYCVVVFCCPFLTCRVSQQNVYKVGGDFVRPTPQ
jgi:hypothetical protein